jgi:hypothetical protein
VPETEPITFDEIDAAIETAVRGKDGLTLTQLPDALERLAVHTDPQERHRQADVLLLAYAFDAKVTAAFNFATGPTTEMENPSEAEPGWLRPQVGEPRGREGPYNAWTLDIGPDAYGPSLRRLERRAVRPGPMRRRLWRRSHRRQLEPPATAQPARRAPTRGDDRVTGVLARRRQPADTHAGAASRTVMGTGPRSPWRRGELRRPPRHASTARCPPA